MAAWKAGDAGEATTAAEADAGQADAGESAEAGEADAGQGDGDAREGAQEHWLHAGVVGVGAASFLADAGHEVPTALLPSLVRSTLGASPAALGLIEGVSDGVAGVARLVGGRLSDDPGRRRRVAVGGYTATAVLASLTGAATAVWQVGVLRAGAWAARGLRVPARNALLADLVRPQAYGRAYGFERAMDNLGAIAGPILALVLLELVGLRWAIALSIVPGLLAAVAIGSAVRRAPAVAPGGRPAGPPAVAARGRPGGAELPSDAVRLRRLLQGDLGRLLGGVSLFELGNVAATLLVLRATDLLEGSRGAERATQLAVALYLAHNLAATVASVLAGRLADRRGPLLALVTGVGLFAAAYTGFAVVGATVALLGAAFVAAGLGIGCVETAEHAAVATLAPADLRGSAFGMLAAVQSFGNLAASGTAGLVWATVSPRAAFLYVAGWMVASLGVLTLAVVKVHRRPR